MFCFDCFFFLHTKNQLTQWLFQIDNRINFLFNFVTNCLSAKKEKIFTNYIRTIIWWWWWEKKGVDQIESNQIKSGKKMDAITKWMYGWMKPFNRMKVKKKKTNEWLTTCVCVGFFMIWLPENNNNNNEKNGKPVHFNIFTNKQMHQGNYQN